MIPLPKEKIDDIFDKAESQYDYWSALYRVAFPNWDDIKKIKGFPHVSEETNSYIIAKCIEWDDAHNLVSEHGLPVLSGGLWINKGFGTAFHGEYCDIDWMIDVSGVEVKYKDLVKCLRCGEEYYPSELINGYCPTCDAELNG